MLDPYQTLQVPRDASQDEIKRAYRRLAKELHPDLNPGDAGRARRFRDIVAAYDMVSDEARRRQYDREAAAQMAGDHRVEPRAAAYDDGLDSFFRTRGWGFRRDTRPGGEVRRRGADFHQSLRIGFVEAALGTRRRIAVNDRRTLEVAVPPLTQDGQTLRLKGQGGPGQNGGPDGDVLVEITVDPHPLFVRKEYDIHMTLAVSLPDAVLGAAVAAPTIHGTVQLRIPKGSNTDTVLRLKGKGLPVPGGLWGDQYVTLKIVLPDKPDPELVQLVEAWAKRRPYAVRNG